MKKLILMLTLMALALSASMAMAIDVNWDSIRQTWNTQQAYQKAADKKAKADQGQMALTIKAQIPGPETRKTR
ncbi:MAG: hypothetical protein ACLP5H_27600 [Desulfomonilaceae bacterium]